jgi:hypothetical protein
VPALAALAQSVPSVEKPDLKVGDRWAYRTIDLWANDETVQYELKVTGTNGDDIELDRTTTASKVAANIGSTSRRKADRSTWTLADSNVVDGKYVVLAFPLEVGKSWEYKYSFTWRSSGTNVRKMTAKVEGWEEVQVPAGKFKAMKVVHSGHNTWTRNDGKSVSGTVSEIFWYAPEVRRVVKREYRDTDGGKTQDQVRDELTAYEVK